MNLSYSIYIFSFTFVASRERKQALEMLKKKGNYEFNNRIKQNGGGTSTCKSICDSAKNIIQNEGWSNFEFD